MYVSCALPTSPSYQASGGSGGGRVFIKASSIHVDAGATITANGTAGVSKTLTYSSSTYTFGGGAGSGGSIWLVSGAGGISGDGKLQAVGGASVSGSGAGGGGRIALQAATSVSSSLSVSARAGSGSAGYLGCGGAAGTALESDTAGRVLSVDNEGVASAGSILTPYPKDLSGYVLAGLDIKGSARVQADSASSNNNLTSSSILISQQSQITGNSFVVVTSNHRRDGDRHDACDDAGRAKTAGC